MKQQPSCSPSPPVDIKGVAFRRRSLRHTSKCVSLSVFLKNTGDAPTEKLRRWEGGEMHCLFLSEMLWLFICIIHSFSHSFIFHPHLVLHSGSRGFSQLSPGEGGLHPEQAASLSQAGRREGQSAIHTRSHPCTIGSPQNMPGFFDRVGQQC